VGYEDLDFVDFCQDFVVVLVVHVEDFVEVLFVDFVHLVDSSLVYPILVFYSGDSLQLLLSSKLPNNYILVRM
jgi:hypothetical protein